MPDNINLSKYTAQILIAIISATILSVLTGFSKLGTIEHKVQENGVSIEKLEKRKIDEDLVLEKFRNINKDLDRQNEKLDLILEKLGEWTN